MLGGATPPMYARCTCEQGLPQLQPQPQPQPQPLPLPLLLPLPPSVRLWPR